MITGDYIKKDLEKSILGCFLLHDNFHMYWEKLSIDMFNFELHKKIFMSMCCLFEDKITIDPLTVMSRMSVVNLYDINDHSISYYDDFEYLYALANECPSNNHISDYIHELELHNSKGE